MSDQDQNDQREIIDKLKGLPQIQDTRNKKEVFSQISSHPDLKRRKINRKKKWMPIVSATAAALFLILLLPVFFNTDTRQISEEDSMNEAYDMPMDETSENHSYEQEQESAGQEINRESAPAEQENSQMETVNESLVVHHVSQDQNIYFAGIPDLQAQYVIPIAFINSGERDLQGFYNNMDEYLGELNSDTGEYLFENVEFEIDHSSYEVAMALPNDFSLNGSAATANMFEKILSEMFRPYGTEKVTIHTDNGEPAEFDPFGDIDEMQLQEMTPSGYKLYELGNTKMLIQIPHNDQTSIEEAIQGMKEDEAELHVFKTVPEDIQFTIEQENNQLNFRFSEDTDFTEGRDSLDMIEAVLMTAKSYGYKQVKFENTEQQHIGPYNLTEPLPVPEAVNPIYLND